LACDGGIFSHKVTKVKDVSQNKISYYLKLIQVGKNHPSLINEFGKLFY